eukprot:scaffold102028_cov28-Tisochrysis_lutea.AAC.1
MDEPTSHRPAPHLERRVLARGGAQRPHTQGGGGWRSCNGSALWLPWAKLGEQEGGGLVKRSLAV